MVHPLSCGDIVMQRAARQKEFIKDITDFNRLKKDNLWQSMPEKQIEHCIVWENKTVLVTSPSLQVILATKNIFEMNGYRPQEVIGKYPKMFQGEATSIESRKKIKIAIEKHLHFDCNIINYRKDGSLYICHIEGFPIFDNKGKLVNYIAFETAS